jgi:DNA polymerase III alpha subunit
MELAMYKASGLYPILQVLIYVVDPLRTHHFVWGVGRGSSVASYLLHLIGVHKVDSVKYNLDIKEFLKR